MNPDMVAGLTITVVGVATVFVVLIALSYCFGAMTFFTAKKKDKPETSDIPTLLTTASDGDGLAGFPEGEGAPDSDELAIVISTALAAFMSKESIVSSIRRVEDTAAWSRTGRHDHMVTRLN